MSLAWHNTTDGRTVSYLTLLCAGTWVALGVRCGLYRHTAIHLPLLDVPAIIATTLQGGALILVPLALTSDGGESLLQLGTLVLAGMPCRVTARLMVQALMRYLGPLARSRLLIVGSGYVAQHLAATCLKYTGLGITVVGFVDDDDLRTDLSQEHALPIFQLPVFKRADLERVLEQHNVDHVVFAFSRQPDSEAVDLVHLCRNHPNVQVSLVSRLFDAIPARTRLLDVYGIPLIQFETSGQRLALACKRIFDVVAAGLGLIVTLPVLLPAALAIRLESPGPILFRQTRVGRHGTPFVMYKLRSMRQPRPGEDVNASSRHTRMGCILRTSSIDELPQLWNVLRGDMSLVGPRPEQEPYVKLFSAHIPRYQQRHRMRGGLTGLAQVSRLRGDTSIVERTRLDNFYIDNWSLWRDVRILLLTFAALRPSSQGIGGEAMFRDVVAEIATQVAQQAERAETVTQRDDTDHGASVPVRTSERHGVTAG